MNPLLASVEQFFEQLLTHDNMVTFGIIALTLFAILLVYRMLKDVSPLLVFLLLCIGAVGLMMYWVKSRKEPAFMTPAVEVISQFLPEGFSETQK